MNQRACAQALVGTPTWTTGSQAPHWKRPPTETSEARGDACESTLSQGAQRTVTLCVAAPASCVDFDTDIGCKLSNSRRFLLPCHAPTPRGRSRRAWQPGTITAPSRTTENDRVGVFCFLIYFSVLGEKRVAEPKGAYKTALFTEADKYF